MPSKEDLGGKPILLVVLAHGLDKAPSDSGLVDQTRCDRVLATASLNRTGFVVRSDIVIFGPMAHRRGVTKKIDPSGNHGLSRRAVLGTTGAALAVPLVAGRSTIEPPSTFPTRPLASLAELARPNGAQGVGTRFGSLAATLEAAMLDARAYGVIGDGQADDTRAVQALLDHCAQNGGRIAYFGSLTVRITGPLVSRGVGIVFEPSSYGGAGTSGFVASGAGYVALTVLGSVADFCVTLTGETGADIAANGRIDRDRRPRIDGIAFGTNKTPFAMSTVRAVRVSNLAGVGVRHTQCWDATFLSVSVERCGRDDAYAFSIEGDAQRTCNETFWARVQVEEAIGCAIHVDPGTLSCTFAKIHSERAIARGSLPTWLLGGSCIYASVRLTAVDPQAARLSIVGNQVEFQNLRAEGGMPVTVDASGGTITFHNPGAVLRPAPNQSGIVNVVGGVVSVLGMGGGWNLVGCQVGRLEVGFMSPGALSTVTGCVVAELLPEPGGNQGELMLSATRVMSATVSGAGRLRGLHLHDNSRLIAGGGTLICTDQFLLVDASSRIEGNVVLQRAALRLAGAITGTLEVRGPVHDARADDGAVVERGVVGWGPPTVPASPGAWSVNLAAGDERQGRAVRQVVVGWRYAVGAWRAMRMEIEG